MQKYRILVWFEGAGFLDLVIEHVDVTLAVIEALTEKSVVSTLKNGYPLKCVNVEYL